MREVSATETELFQVLAWVEAGEEIVITRHGQAVARVLSPPPSFDRDAARRAAAEIKAMSKGVTLGGLLIKDLIREGRM